MSEKKTPAALDRISDKVLSYRPKPKSDPAKKRAYRKKSLSGSHLYNSQKSACLMCDNIPTNPY